MNEHFGNFSQTILVEADMLVDTEFGLIRLIRDKYANEDFFFKDILNLDSKLLKGVLMERTMFNPLQVAFKDESLTDYMDAFYTQFMEQEYEEILKRSCLTNIVNLVKMGIDTEGIVKFCILCKNKMQKDFMTHVMSDCLPSLFSIVIDDKDTFDVSPYSAIFVKDIRNLVRYANLHGKVIYLANMMYNLDQKIYEERHLLAIREEYVIYITVDEFKFITLYPYDNSYSINRNFEQEKEEYNELEHEDIIDNEFVQRVFKDINLKGEN